MGGDMVTRTHFYSVFVLCFGFSVDSWG